MVASIAGCHKQPTDVYLYQRADSLLDEAVRQRQLERVLMLCDSLEAEGVMAETSADLWRG